MHDSRESPSEICIASHYQPPSSLLHLRWKEDGERERVGSSISTIDAAAAASAPQKSLEINGCPIDRVRYQQRFTIHLSTIGTTRGKKKTLSMFSLMIKFPQRTHGKIGRCCCLWRPSANSTCQDTALVPSSSRARGAVPPRSECQ